MDLTDVDEVPVLPAATARHRGRRVVLGGVVVAALAAGGTGLAVTLTGHESAGAGAAPVSTQRTDPATQVVHDGDRVEGTGSVVVH